MDDLDLAVMICLEAEAEESEEEKEVPRIKSDLSGYRRSVRNFDKASFNEE